MVLGLPDWQKMQVIAAPVLPAGQAQLTYFSFNGLAPTNQDILDVYTVPTGKRLYLFFVDISNDRDVMLRIGVKNETSGDIFGFEAAMHGTLNFPFGAGWVFEAGENLRAYITNDSADSTIYFINIFGVVVDA